MYLMLVAQNAQTYSVVKTASAAIHAYHRFAPGEDERCVTEHPLVCAVRETAKRALGVGVRNRKAPLDIEVLTRFAERAVRSGQFLPMLSATMMLVGFCGFMRYDDLCNIYVDEIKFYDDHMEIFLETRKNDVLREGNVIVFVAGTGWRCPMRWCRWLIGKAGLEGHVRLFQRFDGVRARWRPSEALATYGSVPGHEGEPMLFSQCQRLVLGGVAEEMGVSLEQVQSEFGWRHAGGGGGHPRPSVSAARRLEVRYLQEHVRPGFAGRALECDQGHRPAGCWAATVRMGASGGGSGGLTLLRRPRRILLVWLPCTGY
jgi:hypothetical protein